MTWAQLRFQLLQTAPGLPLDLFDAWLNGRYEQVLEATDWTGLKAHATIATQAAYQSSTDTATLTAGNAGVAGVGTAWTPGLVGQQFYRPGDSATYAVTAVGGATALTLDRPYEGNGVDAAGTVYAGASYVFMQNVYALPADCSSVIEILDPATGFPLTPFSKSELDASAGPRTLVNDPASYAVYDDSPETNPPVLHQVELFPPPLHARGMALAYRRAAAGFDGTDTYASPLPWVSTSVMLYGARADLAVYQGKFVQAAAYEKKFQEELARLLLVEHAQRREKPKLRMAGRFTRHRLARAGRGLSNYWGPGQGGPN
jgi:hypothetical protein